MHMDTTSGFPHCQLGPLHLNLFVLCNLPLLVLGIVQLIYAAEASGFVDSTSDFKPGSYFVGITSLIVFLFTVLMPHYGSKTTTFLYVMGLPILALVALIGTLIDGIHFAVAGYIKSCGNQLGDVWGDVTLFDDVQDECFPNGRTNVLNDRCYCVLGAKSSCYVFREGDGFSSDDCEPLIDDYGHLLKVSYALALTIFFLTWILCPMSYCTRFLLRREEQPKTLDPVDSIYPTGSQAPTTVNPVNSMNPVPVTGVVTAIYAPPPVVTESNAIASESFNRNYA